MGCRAFRRHGAQLGASSATCCTQRPHLWGVPQAHQCAWRHCCQRTLQCSRCAAVCPGHPYHQPQCTRSAHRLAHASASQCCMPSCNALGRCADASLLMTSHCALFCPCRACGQDTGTSLLQTQLGQAEGCNKSPAGRLRPPAAKPCMQVSQPNSRTQRQRTAHAGGMQPASANDIAPPRISTRQPAARGRDRDSRRDRSAKLTLPGCGFDGMHW